MKRLLLTVALAGSMALTLFADSAATFPGGEEALDQYLTTNLKYPAAAKENGIEGVVDVTFTVQPDGSIGGIKIARMVDPDLEQEAIRLVKQMPKWTPATKGDQPVASPQSVSVSFAL